MTRQPDAKTLARRIAQGKGSIPADLVIADVRLFDLVTGALTQTDIAICGDTIVGTYGRYRGERIDRRARPHRGAGLHRHASARGIIARHAVRIRSLRSAARRHHGDLRSARDGERHRHCSLRLFSRCRRMHDHGSARAVVELRSGDSSRNVGREDRCRGSRALSRSSKGHRTCGVHELSRAFSRPIPRVSRRSQAFADRHIDGHAPLVRGLDLNGYLAAGIRTDHETTTAEEALEKIRKGMTVLIREGSVSKDLHALRPILTVETSPFLALCTDDRNPLDIAEEGHLDYMIRTLISRSAASRWPLIAPPRSTAAQAFGLKDRGMIAPGKRADIVLLDDLETCAVSDVFSAGRLVNEASVCDARHSSSRSGATASSSRCSAPTISRIAASPAEMPVIGVVPGKDHHRVSCAPSCHQKAKSPPAISIATSRKSPSSRGTASTAIWVVGSSRVSE